MHSAGRGALGLLLGTLQGAVWRLALGSEGHSPTRES